MRLFIFEVVKSIEDYRGNLFKNINTNLDEEDFKRRNTNGSKGFVRTRILTFKITFLFISQLLKRSLQRELNDFFGKLNATDYSIQHVTKGAFLQDRSKLKHEGFVELSNNSVDYFYSNAPYLLWDKYRILACDGSTIMLPNSKSISAEFGTTGFGPHASSQRSVATISLVYDVLNLITLNAKMAAYTQHETTLLKQAVNKGKI